jgi:MFS family permease
MILGLGALVVVLPLSLILRHKPEQYGYKMDGKVANTEIFDGDSITLKTIEIDVRAKQAIKTSTFWRIALAYTYHLMVLAAVVTHVMPYLSSIGISRSMSSLVATGIPLISVGGRVSFGCIGDRIDKKQVAAVAFAMIGLGSLCFGSASILGSWLIIPFLILFIIGYGGNIALRPSLVRKYFGRKDFGTVFGLVMGIGVLGNMIGPPLAGWVFDNWGSYQGIWFVFAGLALTAMLSILTVSPVRGVVRPG